MTHHRNSGAEVKRETVRVPDGTGIISYSRRADLPGMMFVRLFDTTKNWKYFLECYAFFFPTLTTGEVFYRNRRFLPGTRVLGMLEPGEMHAVDCHALPERNLGCYVDPSCFH